MTRRLSALALLLLTACSSATAKPTPHPGSPLAHTTAVLHWKSCGESFQCTTMRVPLDYDHPDPVTDITLSLIRIPAQDQKHRIGSLVVNPGGPGASGIQFLRDASFLFDNLNTRFDIVSFDPRGVGESAPIRCLTGPEMDAYIALDPQPSTAAGVQQAISAGKQFAQECAARNPVTLSLVGTRETARDLDLIRQALGDTKLSFLGFSYGTYLASVYATLFPSHVRAEVLDGAVDPTLSSDDNARAQAQGFETNLNAFLADCAAHTTCTFYNGGNPTAALNALLARLTATPLHVGTRTLGIGEAFLGVLTGLYSPATWGPLAKALANAQKGDGALLLTFADTYDERKADGSYSNQIDANTAINCDDGPQPGPPAHLEALAQELKPLAPHFGVASGLSPVVCDFWPTPPDGIRQVSSVGAPPLLIIGATSDPATPYAWAQGLARQLVNSVLVTRVGDGHISYDKSSCVRDIVDAYFFDPTSLPATGTSCATD